MPGGLLHWGRCRGVCRVAWQPNPSQLVSLFRAILSNQIAAQRSLYVHEPSPLSAMLLVNLDPSVSYS